MVYIFKIPKVMRRGCVCVCGGGGGGLQSHDYTS